MSDENETNDGDVSVGFLYKTMRDRDPRKRRVKPVQSHLIQVNFGIDDSEDDSDYQVNFSDCSDDELDITGGSDDRRNGEKKEKEEENIDDEDNTASDSADESGSQSDGSSDESEEESEAGNRGRNFFDAIDSDDDDDEDYVPRKKQKQGEKHVEKQRIKSPDIVKTDIIPEENNSARPMKVLICCVCLGDISEVDDEIVECDNCGVAVHEGCYGISDNQSAASTDSSASTEPWFCDACKAGVKPDCELCPNEGGIFKETDAGKWVHLVCALYTPGVAFGDVDKLAPVTLFEMPYSKWGVKECSLCEDTRFSRTGVCVSCDAGMCRSFFHVTCAQRNGLLSEASPDEDIADPFYAYCKLHADKNASRAKRRNYLAIQSHVRQHASSNIQDEKEKLRYRRKLNRHRQKYLVAKGARPPSWVPPQKLIRYLTSSPSVMKKMLRKAELMGIITQTQHVSHSTENKERKKSHINPALSSEFVTYYLDRNVRIERMKSDLKELQRQNLKLRSQDVALRNEYDKLLKDSKMGDTDVRKDGEKLWSLLSGIAGKSLPAPEFLKPKKVTRSPTRKDFPKSSPAIIKHCGLCSGSHDQHLLARCDKCHNWYHLGCLDPPLTRMPKKTSHMGWQCSVCAETSSDDSDDSNINVDAPRRLREKIKEPAKFSTAQQEMEFLFPVKKGRKKKKRGKTPSTKKPPKSVNKEWALDGSLLTDEPPAPPGGIKKASKGRQSNTPSDPVTIEDKGPATPSDIVTISDEHEEKLDDGDVIRDGDDEGSRDEPIKEEMNISPPTPSKQQGEVSRTGRKIFKKKYYDDDNEESDVSSKPGSSSKKVSPDKDLGVKPQSVTKKLFGSHCVSCGGTGDRSTMVSCDSCEQCYHFGCLDPPFKKSPKQRGYTWHCEACDTTDESEDEIGDGGG